MKKFAFALTSLALAFGTVNFAVTPAFAAADGIAAGKALYSTAGKRLGTIYRVKADGSPQLILNGKLVTFPASSVSVVNGKAQTAANYSSSSASQ